MFIVASIDYRILGSLSWFIYGGAVAALALVLVPGIGTEMEAEVRLGALAPRPTDGTAVDQTTWETMAGIETPKPWPD